MVNKRRVGPPPLLSDFTVAMTRAARDSISYQAAPRERDERVRAAFRLADEDHGRRCTDSLDKVAGLNQSLDAYTATFLAWTLTEFPGAVRESPVAAA